MDARTRQLVRRRAGDRCGYCHIPQEADSYFTFHVEHIVANQHGGSDDPANLALACHCCNGFTSPNLSGIDPATEEVTPLYHPRQDAEVAPRIVEKVAVPLPGYVAPLAVYPIERNHHEHKVPQRQGT